MLVWESKNMASYQPISNIGSIMLQANWWAHVTNSFSKFVCQIMLTVSAGRLKMRRPALHAILSHNGTRPARIAPPNTLTDAQTQFLLKAQPYLKSMTQTLKSKPYIILHYRSITCLKTLVGSGTLYYHFTEVQPV